ncbi:hypothetical protein C9374_004311 [Naegleria lovaniensis]|uniref:Uncharacterized protein n=1 Tax=Naegleria lovaniensis TaxID=51637 RepID=A0AA88GT41_NAELO|nr:uncharacterized protein C9374_004311 [Naegleria lovaniensis]KAG2383640.1 hypothetical protein C9374_004311 [Naegleria lovaniensis]
MTYHKMRLINREYSIRMKINILKTTHIDMSSTHDKTSFLFYLTFMRAQRLYAEGLLDMNHPFIYQDRKTISDLLSQQHPNVALPQMFDDPVKLNDDTTSNSNTSEEIVEEQLIPSWDALTNQESLSDEFLSSTIQKMATETINKSLAKTKKVKKTPLRANYDASAKTNNENSTETVYNYIIPFELFTLSTFPEADRNRALGSDQLIEYIGKNTLLESLSLCQLRDDQLLVVFSCCPNLTKMRAIDWDSFHMDRMPALSKLETIEIFNCYSDSFFESHEFLDNIRTSSPLTNIILSLSDLSETDASTVSMWRGASIFYGKKQIQTRSNDCKITVNINHISDTDYISDIIEALTQLAYFKRDGLSFHRLVQRLCRENILCVKQLMDTLFRDFMIPLECIGGKHRLPAALFEYAVYLANTYQNGRFLSSQAGMDELKSALEAGLQIGSCLEEVLFQLTPALIEPALTYLNTIYSPKKMECLVRCLFLHTLHFRSDPDFFVPVLAFIAHNNIDTSLIFSPIRCALPRYESQRIRFITNSEMKYISIPSAALVMQSSFQCASLYLDLISPDQLLYQNELGDTFLHIPLVFEEQLTLEIALQKQPKLAHILNNESRSVMHILARSYTNAPILYRLITRYHADIFHKDMYGQTPFDDDNEVVLDMSNNNVVLLTIRDAKGYFAFK